MGARNSLSDPLCEKCGGTSKVVATLFERDTHEVVRRRSCQDCDHRFYTVQSEERQIEEGARVRFLSRLKKHLVRVERVS